MLRPRHVSLVVTVSLALTVAAAPAPAAPAKPKKSAVALKAFRSCTGLINYGNRNRGRVEAMRFRPMRTGGPLLGAPAQDQTGAGRPAPASASPQSSEGAGSAGTDYSTTNVQEAGVDEPDIVKTDGKRIFAMAQNTLHAVDASGDTPALKGSLKFDRQSFGHQLLLQGDTLLVAYTVFIAPSPPEGPQPDQPVARPASSPAMPYGRTVTKLAQVDATDLSALRIVRTLDVDGNLVDSRLVGSVARVVLSTTPPAMQPVPLPADAGANADERARGSRRANQWLPRGTFENVRTKRSKRRALTACRSTRKPATFSGMGMLTILTIDLDKGLEPVDSDSLMSDAETVYASTKSLYVATRRWREAPANPEAASGVTNGVTTTVHKFDISDPSKTVYKASGVVPGYLLSQWALSEHEGVLRVASTTMPTWWGFVPEGVVSQSYVTTLRESGGVLAPLGSLGGLGKGERIYSVRFIDKVGYIVTFRQTDPLYTVDVSDPAKPAVLGELKILGYSAYLHPAGEGLLIGVGQDATEEGRRTGAQMSLFDVSDLRNPTRLAQATLGKYSSSEVENDPHAFLFWQATELAVIPLNAYNDDGSNPFMGAVGFKVGRAAGVQEIARISHPFDQYPTPVRRSLVIGSRLYTLSDFGLKASALDTLADGPWVPFPKPGQ